MTRGRRNVVKNGKVLLHGVKVPAYGYRLKDETLAIYEPEAKIVRLIFTWYVYGDENGKKLPINAIAKRLTEMKVPTWADTHGTVKKKRGRGVWCAASVSNILNNETYAGTWYYGKQGNDRDYWLSTEVPAIVSRETWEKAQERRAQNKKMSRRNTKAKYLVGRRVTCGQCGGGMVGCVRHSKRKRYLYYSCWGYKRVHKCTMTNFFRADHVDSAVWETVRRWLQDPEVLEQSLEEVKAKLEQKNQPLFDRLAVADDLLAENRRELEKLLDLYLSTNLEKEMFLDRKTRYETTIASIEKERADLVMTLESQALTDEQIKTIVDFAKKVATGLKEAEKDFEARRRIIDLLDVRVTLVVEDGVKVAYVRWLVSGEEEKRLSIEPMNTHFTVVDNRAED